MSEVEKQSRALLDKLHNIMIVRSANMRAAFDEQALPLILAALAPPHYRSATGERREGHAMTWTREKVQT